MRRQEVIEAFLDGKTGTSGNLISCGECLMSYAYRLAWYEPATQMKVHVNFSRKENNRAFSNTTQAHRNAVIRAAEARNRTVIREGEDIA